VDQSPVKIGEALAGRYRLERELGAGGMATVYLAHDEKHDRAVALKVLRPEITAIVGSERFLQEIRITAGLDHPHILTLIDSGEADGRLYYVLPYVRGETLRARLVRETHLPIDEAVAIARQVASALDYAHRHGVIHRDIKPENILLHEGEAVLTDFGIAIAVSQAGGKRITETGLSLGTPQYMSPEQAMGERQIDARTDVYALGAVLYEMLAGEPPVTGPTTQAIVAKLLTELPTRLRTIRDTVPEALDAATTRAIAKLPVDRFPTAAAFAEALRLATVPRRSSGIAAAARPAPGRRGWGPIVLGAAAVAVLLLAGYVALAGRGGARSGAGDAGGASRSIAVLPFTSLSADPTDEYFSDGMSEELITALSRVSGLRVVPRTSSFSFKNRNLRSREIGAELHVETLLEGTVRRLGGRVRVAAQLVSVSSDSVLWSDEFQRDIKDVWAVQDEIAHAIVNALAVRLAGGRETQLVTRATASPEAYEWYLRGRFAFGKRTGEGLAEGIDAFEHAIRLDSAFAAAWSGLSDVFTVRSLFGYVAPREGLGRAQQAATRALALDSSLAEARASLGIVSLWYDWDLVPAERELDRAVALDPHYSTAHLFLAWHHVAARRPADALHAIEQARQSDPLSVIINARVATMLYFAGRYPDAVAQLHRSLTLDSTNAITHAELARAYAVQHRCAEALAELRFVPATFPNFEGSVRGTAPALCGRRADALAAVRDLERRGATGFVMASKIAIVFAALGERDSAFTWLDRAAAQREWPILVLGVEPLFDGLHGDPRFTRLETLIRRGAQP